MSSFLDEAQVELGLIELLRELGYGYAFGPDIACDGPRPERTSYADVVLDDRLRQAITRINPDVPTDAIDEAICKVAYVESPSLIENNRRFHRILTDGVPVEYNAEDGRIVHDSVRIIDFTEPDNNDWLAVNQFTVIENKRNRRADVVVFINGLPISVAELKNPSGAGPTNPSGRAPGSHRTILEVPRPPPGCGRWPVPRGG